MLAPFAEHVKRVAQNFVVFELCLSPVRRQLFDLKRFAILKVGAQSIHCFAKHTIGLAFVHLKRTNLVDQVVDHVTQVHGIQHSEAKIDAELQSRLSGLGLDSVAILEQQNPEAVKARVLKRETIFGFIHSEAAWATRTSGEENIVIQNMLA